MKVVKAVLTMVVLVILLAACIDDPTVTPTVSPLPTVSPIAMPEAPRLQMAQAPAQKSLTAEVIAGVVAAVISILLEVVPGLADKWGKIDSTYKRLAWLGGCLVIPLVVLSAGCLGLDLGVIAPACDEQGVIEALRVGFAAYFTGQATFAIAGRAIRKQLRKC